MQYSPELHGKFVFEYDNQGNMVNYHTISSVAKKKKRICVYRMQFKDEILPGGELKVTRDTRIKKVIKSGRGVKLTRFFIATEKTEYDYSIFVHRNKIIEYVTKCTNLNELEHIYAQIKSFENSPAPHPQIETANNKPG